MLKKDEKRSQIPIKHRANPANSSASRASLTSLTASGVNQVISLININLV